MLKLRFDTSFSPTLEFVLFSLHHTSHTVTLFKLHFEIQPLKNLEEESLRGPRYPSLSFSSNCAALSNPEHTGHDNTKTLTVLEFHWVLHTLVFAMFLHRVGWQLMPCVSSCSHHQQPKYAAPLWMQNSGYSHALLPLSPGGHFSVLQLYNFVVSRKIWMEP